MANLNSTTISDLEITGSLVINGTEITPKAAATYTPSTSAQTIAAGQYLVGAQTIAAMPSGALSAGVSGSISFTPSVSSTMTTTTTKPSGTDGTDYFSITGSGSSSGTITGSASVSTNGYVTTSNNTTGGSASGSVGSNAVKYVAKATASSTSVTPGTSNQSVTISAGYTSGITISVYGNSNLTAANIKSGVTIFGVTGSLTPESHTAYSGSYSVA